MSKRPDAEESEEERRRRGELVTGSCGHVLFSACLVCRRDEAPNIECTHTHARTHAHAHTHTHTHTHTWNFIPSPAVVSCLFHSHISACARVCPPLCVCVCVCVCVVSCVYISWALECLHSPAIKPMERNVPLITANNQIGKSIGMLKER